MTFRLIGARSLAATTRIQSMNSQRSLLSLQVLSCADVLRGASSTMAASSAADMLTTKSYSAPVFWMRKPSIIFCVSDTHKDTSTMCSDLTLERLWGRSRR